MQHYIPHCNNLSNSDFLSYFRLRASNVLLINIRGLGSEIAKDILLSGINSLTILDDGKVTKEELLKNFLLSSDTVGNNVSY